MDAYLIRSSSSGSINSKRSADDLSEIWRPAKRSVVTKNPLKFDKSRDLPIQNKFQSLPVDANADDPASKPYHEAVTLVKKTGHIPPIVIEMKKDWTHESIKNTIAKFTNRFHLQYRRSNKVAVICYTPGAHEAVKEGLLQTNTSFLTYTRKDEKTPKAVIRGLPAYIETELPGELEKLGFAGATVTKLKSPKLADVPCPPFLVKLPPGTDITKFRQIKYLFHCVITIQKYKPNNQFGTQCFRCQRFGHSSRNCNMPPRCVKCTEFHATADCPKRGREEPARCCNCDKEHPANYRECSARVAYLKRIDKKNLTERRPPIIPKRAWKETLPNHSQVIKSQESRKLGPEKTWADLFSNRKLKDTEPDDASEDFHVPKVYPEPPRGDSIAEEMLSILLTIKSLKTQYKSCSSMMEKVMLVLTQLGQYV